MRILVIDDTQKHLDAAVATLKGHDVTLCSSYDEATQFLEIKYVDANGESCGRWNEGAIATPYWDAVLTDLLMPPGHRGDRGGKFVGQEMALGWSLAMVAAKRGAKYVALASDACHHDHPASEALDRLDHGTVEPHIFNVDGAKVLMTNQIYRIELEGEEEVDCNYCFGHGNEMHDWDEDFCDRKRLPHGRCFCAVDGPCKKCGGTGKMLATKEGKDWGKLLDRLLAA